VLNDEIYNNTMFYEDFHSPLELFPERKDMTIVTNSFSKGFRMYTKRIGFAILPTELQRNLRVIQQHTLLCTDPCYQYGMIAALEDEDSPRELMNVFKDRAEYTTTRLTGTRCTPIASEGGFYAILRCEEWNKALGFPTSKELARDILEKVHVAVVPVPTLVFHKIFGPHSATIAITKELIACMIISLPLTRGLRDSWCPRPRRSLFICVRFRNPLCWLQREIEVNYSDWVLRRRGNTISLPPTVPGLREWPRNCARRKLYPRRCICLRS